MATIITKNSSTAAAVPLVGDLQKGELAVNVTDKRLFTKDNSNVVVEVGTAPSTLSLPNGTANGVAYLNGSKVLTTGSALTFDGTTLLNTGVVKIGNGVASNTSRLMVNNQNGVATGLQLFQDGIESWIMGMPAGAARLAWSASGAEQMALTSTGLGIGTSAPNQKLHVVGNIRTTNSLIENTGTSVNFGTITGGSLNLLSGNGAANAILDSSGNLGLGVTPSASTLGPVLQIANGATLQGLSGGYTELANNAIHNAGFKYIATGAATLYEQGLGVHKWLTAPSGTAGTAISFTQAMALDASGNLGIGTSSPATRLHAVGDNVAFRGQLSLQTATVSNFAQITLYDRTTLGAQIFQGYGGVAGVGDLTIQNVGAAAIIFGTTNAERMRLDPAGNLGLGVTPSAWRNVFNVLDIGRSALTGSTGSAGYNLAANAFQNSAGNWIYKTTDTALRYEGQAGAHAWLTAPSGTAGAPISFTQAMTLTQGGNLLVGTTVDALGQKIRVADTNGILSFGAPNAGVGTLAYEGGPGNLFQIDCANLNGAIAFRTRDGSTPIERARITSGGYFKAAPTAAYESAAGAFHEFQHLGTGQGRTALVVGSLNVGYDSATVNYSSHANAGSAADFYHYEARRSDGVVYRVSSIGNVTNLNNSYGAISDLKLKENITDCTPKLAALNQLRVVNYNLKSDESKLKQIGLIAQEVEQVFPGLVEETPDVDPETKEPTGEVTKAVKYSVLVPMLLKAVQELTAEVNALKAQIQGA